MGKLSTKINIVQTQLWEKPISKVLSCFKKQHVLSRLFTRNFFLGKKREPIKHLKIIHFAHHSPPCKRSYTCAMCVTRFTNKQSILIWGRWTVDLTAHLLWNFKFSAVVAMVLFQKLLHNWCIHDCLVLL